MSEYASDSDAYSEVVMPLASSSMASSSSSGTTSLVPRIVTAPKRPLQILPTSMAQGQPLASRPPGLKAPLRLSKDEVVDLSQQSSASSSSSPFTSHTATPGPTGSATPLPGPAKGHGDKLRAAAAITGSEPLEGTLAMIIGPGAEVNSSGESSTRKKKRAASISRKYKAIQPFSAPAASNRSDVSPAATTVAAARAPKVDDPDDVHSGDGDASDHIGAVAHGETFDDLDFDSVLAEIMSPTEGDHSFASADAREAQAISGQRYRSFVWDRPLRHLVERLAKADGNCAFESLMATLNIFGPPQATACANLHMLLRRLLVPYVDVVNRVHAITWDTEPELTPTYDKKGNLIGFDNMEHEYFVKAFTVLTQTIVLRYMQFVTKVGAHVDKDILDPDRKDKHSEVIHVVDPRPYMDIQNDCVDHGVPLYLQQLFDGDRYATLHLVHQTIPHFHSRHRSASRISSKNHYAALVQQSPTYAINISSGQTTLLDDGKANDQVVPRDTLLRLCSAMAKIHKGFREHDTLRHYIMSKRPSFLDFSKAMLSLPPVLSVAAFEAKWEKLARTQRVLKLRTEGLLAELAEANNAKVRIRDEAHELQLVIDRMLADQQSAPSATALRDEITTLREQLRASIEFGTRNLQTVNDLRQQLEQVQSTSHDDAEVQQLRDSLDELKGVVNDTKNENTDLAKQNKDLCEIMNLGYEKTDTFRQIIKQLKAELAAAASRNCNLEKDKVRLVQKNDELEEQLSQLYGQSVAGNEGSTSDAESDNESNHTYVSDDDFTSKGESSQFTRASFDSHNTATTGSARFFSPPRPPTSSFTTQSSTNLFAPAAPLPVSHAPFQSQSVPGPHTTLPNSTYVQFGSTYVATGGRGGQTFTFGVPPPSVTNPPVTTPATSSWPSSFAAPATTSSGFAPAKTMPSATSFNAPSASFPSVPQNSQPGPFWRGSLPSFTMPGSSGSNFPTHSQQMPPWHSSLPSFTMPLSSGSTSSSATPQPRFSHLVLQSEDVNKVPTLKWSEQKLLLAYLEALTLYRHQHPNSIIPFIRCLTTEAALGTFKQFYMYHKDATMPADFSKLPENLPWEDSLGKPNLLLVDELVISQLKITYNRAYRQLAITDITHVPCPRILNRGMFDEFLVKFNERLQYVHITHNRRKELLLDRLKERNIDLYDMVRRLIKEKLISDSDAYNGIVENIYNMLNDVTFISSLNQSTGLSNKQVRTHDRNRDFTNTSGSNGTTGNTGSNAATFSNDTASSQSGLKKKNRRSHRSLRGSKKWETNDGPADSSAGSQDRSDKASTQQRHRGFDSSTYKPRPAPQADKRQDSPSPNRRSHEKKQRNDDRSVASDGGNEDRHNKSDGQRSNKPKKDKKKN